MVRQAQLALMEHQRRAAEQVEAELAKAKEKLVRQTQLAAIGQIAASIAHDLRNPLTVIRYAVYFLKRAAPQRQPDLSDQLGRIETQVEIASRIIDNLMEMARAKPPQKEAVDLEEVAADVLRQTVPDDGPACTVQCDPQPLVVSADPTQLRQVLGNLVANAVQAIENDPPPGRPGRITVRGRRADGIDVVEVEDDGPGIPDSMRQRLFEPLVTTRPKGTGLGLAISRQIVELHGGTVEARDAAGRGAVFEIRLPRDGGPAPDDPGSPGE
jgi:signal transduction histidine kinase